jgi:hypothetical protein
MQRDTSGDVGVAACAVPGVVVRPPPGRTSFNKLQLVPTPYLNAARNRPYSGTAGGKMHRIGGEKRRKPSNFIAALPSHPAAGAAAKASAKPTRPVRRAAFTFSAKQLLTRFLQLPALGRWTSAEAWLSMSRQESATGISSPGTAATVSEILGYWKRSAAVGDGCIEISAHSSEVELK